MKTYINQGKRVYIIGNKRLEPNKIFNLTDEEYEKVRAFKEIKPLFIEKPEPKEEVEEVKEQPKEEEVEEIKQEEQPKETPKKQNKKKSNE